MTKFLDFSKLIAFGRLIRVFMSLTLGLAGIAGARLSEAPDLSLSKCVLLFAVGFLTASGGFALNDVQDRDRDGPGHRNPICQESMSLQVAVAVAWSCLMAALLGSLAIGLGWFLISCSQVALLIVYSRVKRWNGIYGNLLTAVLCSSGLVYGSLFGRVSPGFVWLIVASGLFVFGREILKDIADVQDDSVAGLKTLPVRAGKPLASWTAASIGLVALSLAGYGLEMTRSAPIYLVAYAVFIAVGVTLLWNAVVGSKRSLAWTLTGTALAMLSIIIISCLPV